MDMLTDWGIVLELCCFEWFQNGENTLLEPITVLELCCFEWFQNKEQYERAKMEVLELCCFEWFQNWSSCRGFEYTSFRAVLFRMVPKRLVALIVPT